MTLDDLDLQLLLVVLLLKSYTKDNMK